MVRVAVKLIVLFILIFAGVQVWYNRLEESLLKVPAPAVASIEQPAEVQTQILRKAPDYTIIIDRNIFQAVITEPEKVEKVVVEEVVAPTKLKLALMGTISGSERNARAIISDEQKKQQDIYQIGDSVQGALIKSIDRGKVILEVNGRDEVLSLKERKGGGPAYVPSPSDFYNEPVEKTVKAPQKTRKPVIRPRPQLRRNNQQVEPESEDQPGLDELPLSEMDMKEPENDEYAQ